MGSEIMILLRLHRSILLKSRFIEELLHQHQCQCCIKVSLTTGGYTFVPQTHKAHTRRRMLARLSKSGQAVHHDSIGVLRLNNLFQDEICFCGVKNIGSGGLDYLLRIFQIRLGQVFHCIRDFGAFKFLKKPRPRDGPYAGSKMRHCCFVRL